MYETKHQPLLPKHKFYKRMLHNLFLGMMLVFGSLLLGMVGYHHFENLSWIDAYANAAMILSGMGPLNPLATEQGKLFAGTYALYSGIVFLAAMVIVFAPVFHRFFHHFNIEDEKK